MTSEPPSRELCRAAAAALVWLCAGVMALGQQPAPSPPSASPQARPIPQQFQQPPSIATSAFRYSAAVSGGRLLTSIFGPTRPAFVTQRLTHSPDMFGDSFLHGQSLQATQALTQPGSTITATLDLPVGGGSHLLVAENNKALPTDRVYVNYNHFENALLYRVNEVTVGPTFTLDQRVSVDRATFGMEKTLLNGSWSAELRVPFVGQNDSFYQPDPGLNADGITAVDSSVFGNISLITKHALYAGDFFVVSTGLGVELPTGDDAQARVRDRVYTIENDAVHLHPFLSVLVDDGEEWFFNGFAQLDAPLTGNDLRVTGGLGTVGTLNDQVLLHLNAGGGYWLYRNSRRTCMTGLAALLELHFTQTLDSTDSVAFASAILPPVTGLLSNRRNHYTLLNLTTGFNAELTPDTILRVAAVMPLMSEANRFFDFEPMVQLTRRF